MRFLVIGAGKQGSACAFDLLRQPAAGPDEGEDPCLISRDGDAFMNGRLP